MAVIDPHELVNAVSTIEESVRLRTEIASYVLGALAIPVVLHFHLLPTVFAGLTVHVLTVKLARRLPVQWRGLGHKFASAALAVVVVLLLLGAGVGLWSFLRGSQGMAALLGIAAETLDNVRRSLPPEIAQAMPPTIEDLREQITNVLREHAHNVSAVGMAGIRTLVYVIFGMVIGGMTALHHFDPSNQGPLVAALYARTGTLADAFDKVVFAQVKISALNTTLTAIYLLVVLPLCGFHLPMAQVSYPAHLCHRSPSRGGQPDFQHGYCADQPARFTGRGPVFACFSSRDPQTRVFL